MMTAKQYIREIIERSCLPRAERKKIKADLENEIHSAIEGGENIQQIIQRMGNPDEVAAELYENFIDIPTRPFREYKSNRTLFGLPLVHIIRWNHTAIPAVRAMGWKGVDGRYGMSSLYGLPTARGVFAIAPKAKGIIAVGNISSGLISIGNISAGIISIGNISVGLMSLGNVALALLVALGNTTVGLLSAGNLAYGYAAVGNLASGKFAVGNRVTGEVTFSITNLSAQIAQLKAFFAGLEAPVPVNIFFGIIKKSIEVTNNPIAVTLIITASLTILLAFVLTTVFVQNKLLNSQIS